jgi:hypothetical protein
MKVTIDELNQAYMKANKFKINGYPVRNYVEVEIDRDPLEGKDIVTPIKLKFELHNNVGPKGSYIIASNVDIIYNED